MVAVKSREMTVSVVLWRSGIKFMGATEHHCKGTLNKCNERKFVGENVHVIVRECVYAYMKGMDG